MKKPKVAVALSGGVDSAVAAALLVKQGYDCTGFHMDLWSESRSGAQNKCCDLASLKIVLRTTFQLKIPFYKLDLKKVFKQKVVDCFLADYAQGLTPNPCVQCNRFIKFGVLLDYLRKKGFDFMATGHYAQLELSKDKNDIYHLLKAKDSLKDQSYFLYNLTQDQLSHLLFPVGGYFKKEVKKMAKEWQLPVVNRSESQEICFFPEKDYRPFLKRNLKERIKSGEVIDINGKVIGHHSGLPLYTIGQRHGFKLETKSILNGMIPPYYVVGKSFETNQLIVGFGAQTEAKEFSVSQLNFIDQENFSRVRSKSKEVEVRIRHQGDFLKGRLKKAQNKNSLRVVLNEPERGVAPGQSAVFYKGRELLGGGIITVDKI